MRAVVRGLPIRWPLRTLPLPALVALWLLTLSSHWAATCRGEESPLGEGWKSAVEIPECRTWGKLEGTGAKVDLWVEKGWLVVRRTNGDAEPQWQVVLARATDPQPPEVRISDKDGSLDIGYRGYFVREASTVEGRIRIYRERKTEQSPDWPLAAVVVQGRRRNWGRFRSAFQTWGSDSWSWVEGGTIQGRPDLFLRLRPETLRSIDLTHANGALAASYAGSVQGGSGVAECHLGDSHAQDEGDLFVANRATAQMAAAGLKNRDLTDWLAKQELKDEMPPITAREWLNAEGKPLLLHDSLAGRVVLVQFLAPDHARHARDSQRLEELHTKYAKQGLEVIGVYVAERGALPERARKAVDEKRFTFPMMVDRPAERPMRHLSGETATRLGVESLPTCFLFDRRGKMVVGFGMEPPEDIVIESQLLLGSPAPPLEAQEWLGIDQPVSLEKLKGNVVLLLFGDGRRSPARSWADLDDRYKKFRDRGLVIVGVFHPSRGQAAKNVFAAGRVTFPIAVDDGETAKRYIVPGLDATFLIDKSGRVVWSNTLEQRYPTVPPSDAQIEELLKAN